MPVPQPGSRLPLPRGESMLVTRTLGVGGMGTVVQAQHHPSGRWVALKFLHDELRDHPTIPKRFEREVQLASALASGHVARTFGVERTSDGTMYMIMELLDGIDLCQLLGRERVLPVQRAARLISQACEALEEAHAHGIVHRDLKPENLFISRAADGSDWVKVLDFGISKVLEGGQLSHLAGQGRALTRVGTTVGTPEYMAPEQLRGVSDLDPSADVYSLGVVLYELLAGRKPFVAANYQELVKKILTENALPLSSFRADLPPGIVDIVVRAMARDRTVRIPSAKALREALLPFATGRRSEGTMVMAAEASPVSQRSLNQPGGTSLMGMQAPVTQPAHHTPVPISTVTAPVAPFGALGTTQKSHGQPPGLQETTIAMPPTSTAPSMDATGRPRHVPVVVFVLLGLVLAAIVLALVAWLVPGVFSF